MLWFFRIINFLLIVIIITTTTSAHQQLPPKLAESMGQKSQSVGTKLKLFCQVEKGSRPLHFTWQKNGHELHISGLGSIDSSEEDSLLVIEHLQAQDSANYTCSVSNAFGTVHQTTVVIVKGFSTFIIIFAQCVAHLVAFL